MRIRHLLPAAAFVAIMISLSATYVILTHHTHTSSSKSIQTSTPHSSPKPAPHTASIAHIFIIMEENKPISHIIGNTDAPYSNSLAKHYALASNYYGVAHPSLPNYLALTSGSTDGIASDCNPPSAGCIRTVRNIADEIATSGRTWKEYAESMPTPCYDYNAGEYVTKHNPFVYYSDIINNVARCKAHVVPFSQLRGDLSSVRTTPDFAFITPNLCNDMHDCSIATGDHWLARNVPMILDSKAFTTQNSLLIITWDEGDSSTNHIAAILTGSAVKQGYTSAARYTHYSLLHTIEDQWGLPPLTANDRQAPLMNGFLQ